MPAKKYECVTLLFSGVVGFNDYCARNSDSLGAMKIVKLLNNLYTTFDVLTDPVKNPNVYKVCPSAISECNPFRVSAVCLLALTLTLR